ncbi:uncharacterized protein LOC127256986 isoform X2 [Andrographis paniculata]|uniref:uncharacterized protein LOC127256986 isoform X2 n=1 Tax=Andrographis paniculata TaxID=175694 RepID=UPI0021E82F3B|nr:uncharacterized protein LOC127256986 isoform X2 [Andrographis paniculata]
MKPKKRKGRPPKSPIPNPNYSDNDDDDRKEKKLKLVVRLPQVDHSSRPSASPSDSEDNQINAKKRKINAVDAGSDDSASPQEKIASKATGETGPTTPLPDKKLLVFILDRLQKKDTHGVFSQPVDLNELPDYLDYVEKPMDFGTIRKNIDGRAYKCLEELEADVDLLCSNAMTYNAANTVFYRQARSIQELAKKDFENLKNEGKNGEPQLKVVRRGRPPSNKNSKKPESSPANSIRPELSSDVTPPVGEDKATGSGSNTYNLRKAPAVNRFRSGDHYFFPYQSRNGENNSQNSGGWNDEFPASILRADMKYGKKQFTVDETKRDTYTPVHTTPAINSSILAISSGDAPRLVPVGLQDPLSYARSLARYGAGLGPVAWKIVSKKLEQILPPGVQFGPGWVGDDPAPSQPFSFSSNSSAGDGNGNQNKPVTPSTSDLSSAVVAHGLAMEGMTEAAGKLKSQHDPSSSWRTTAPFSIQQKPAVPQRNGFTSTSAMATAQDSEPLLISRKDQHNPCSSSSQSHHQYHSNPQRHEQNYSCEFGNSKERVVGGYNNNNDDDNDDDGMIRMQERGKSAAECNGEDYSAGAIGGLHWNLLLLQQQQQQQQQWGGGNGSGSSAGGGANISSLPENMNIIGIPVAAGGGGGGGASPSSHQPDLALQL